MSRLVSHKGLEVGINYIFFVFTKDSDCEGYNMTFIKSIVSSFALLDWFVAMHFIYSLLHWRSTEETNLSGLSAGHRWGAFWINTRQHKRRNNTRNNRQKTAHSSIEQYMSWLSWPPLRSLQKLLLNQHQTRQAQKQDNKQQTKYNRQRFKEYPTTSRSVWFVCRPPLFLSFFG